MIVGFVVSAGLGFELGWAEGLIVWFRLSIGICVVMIVTLVCLCLGGFCMFAGDLLAILLGVCLLWVYKIGLVDATSGWVYGLYCTVGSSGLLPCGFGFSVVWVVCLFVVWFLLGVCGLV